jgi:hydrogenase maturation factor
LSDVEKAMDSWARGKIERETFDQVILPRLGGTRTEVLVGPRHGVDIGVVDIGHDEVMALTTDPFFAMPELGWERAGWFAVHIVASDAATSGLAPQYMTIDLNLPPGLSSTDLEALWESVSDACRELDIAIVAGHTGRYDGCSFPIIGAATAVSIGRASAYVTPAMAQPGDAVVMTKGAAIETTALFGAALGPMLRRELGDEVAASADQLFCRMSVVGDAMTAIGVGVRDAGVTSMHDATEGGVWGGLREMAEASGVGLVVHEEDIYVAPETRAVCDLLHFDPLPASSEGTLLITCRPKRVRELIDRLESADIPAMCIGEMLPHAQGISIVREQGCCCPMEPRADPFWPAFDAAIRRGDAV